MSGDDYTEAARSIIKVRFPDVKKLSDERWGQRWRIDTVDEVAVAKEALAVAEQEMSQQDFEVRIERTGDLSYELLVTTHADAGQGRFLFAIYRALQVFDRKVARVASVEDQPRECWTPFRDWPESR